MSAEAYLKQRENMGFPLLNKKNKGSEVQRSEVQRSKVQRLRVAGSRVLFFTPLNERSWSEIS
jgi:mRNA-degrading endonuclease RelE of RelBE toxin-antitoxin system